MDIKIKGGKSQLRLNKTERGWLQSVGEILATVQKHGDAFNPDEISQMATCRQTLIKLANRLSGEQNGG